MLGLSLCLGTLEAMQGRLEYAAVPWHLFWPEALVRTLPCWLVLAALVPLVVWMSERIRIDRTTWPVAVPVHLLAGVGFLLLHISGSAWLIALLLHDPERGFWVAFRSIFTGYAVAGLFTYACIVAAHHAFRAQAESHARELASRELLAGLTRARLDALRAQLDPHFLFNALNSISVLAMQGERETVVRLLSGLGDVLRMSLDEGRAQEVPLSAELELLERYLELERVRFGERLHIVRNIAPEALPALVPSLVLQPLAENAVRHGVAARRGPAELVIEASRVGTTLRLEVRDSGVGFPTPMEPEGIGLANTRARLQQLHGDAQRMELGTAAEGGARVTIEIPFRVATSGPGQASA